MLNELEQLGMATNDAKVYQAIMELGTVGGGEVSRKTGFHRNIVYESLDRLVARRLITKVYRNKIALFQISDPMRLVEEARQKADVAEKVVEQIKARADIKTDVVVYDGEEGFRTFWTKHIARMNVGDEYYVYGSLGDLWGELMEPILPWFIKQIKKKKIKIKVLAQVVNNKDNIFLASGVKFEARLLPGGYQMPLNANFWEDYVWLQTAVKPYSIIDMFNPGLAKSYKENFDLMWSTAAGNYPKDNTIF